MEAACVADMQASFNFVCAITYFFWVGLTF